MTEETPVDTGPRRIQLRRTKGWRKPAGAVVVARPSRWGNPYRVGDVVRIMGGVVAPLVCKGGLPDDPAMRARNEYLYVLVPAQAVRYFRQFLAEFQYEHEDQFGTWLAPLRGHDLACWCPLDQPCHADVLLEIANGRAS